MKKRQKIMLDAFVWLCAVFVVVTSALPLMKAGSRPLVLQLLFGSFGAGVILARLIRDIKQR